MQIEFLGNPLRSYSIALSVFPEHTKPLIKNHSNSLTSRSFSTMICDAPRISPFSILITRPDNTSFLIYIY